MLKLSENCTELQLHNNKLTEEKYKLQSDLSRINDRLDRELAIEQIMSPIEQIPYSRSENICKDIEDKINNLIENYNKQVERNKQKMNEKITKQNTILNEKLALIEHLKKENEQKNRLLQKMANKDNSLSDEKHLIPTSLVDKGSLRTNSLIDNNNINNNIQMVSITYGDCDETADTTSECEVITTELDFSDETDPSIKDSN
eukprot:UN24715